METNTPPLILGVDLGGTKILAALFTTSLERVARRKMKTPVREGEDGILASIETCIEQALLKACRPISDVAAIGVTVPGVFDRATGTIISTPNLPIANFPLKERLEKRFPVPVYIENDVNAGTYGEYRSGAARGFRHIVGIFPGTGIGGGLILDGRLYIGANGNAGEIGHMIIDPAGPRCGCGRYGCLEALAGRSAMAREAVFLAHSGAAPGTLQAAGTDFANYSSKIFSNAYDNGDRSIVEIVERAAFYLGIGMANCVNLLGPEVIVLGGGLVERLGKRLIDPAERSMREHAMPGICDRVSVVAASLGDDAGVVGAAALAYEHGRG